jgi:N-glycosidase YbiA
VLSIHRNVMRNKKILLCLGLGVFTACADAGFRDWWVYIKSFFVRQQSQAQKHSASVRDVHVFPVSFDAKTQQWNVLLGYNERGGQKWVDFWARQLPKESVLEAAQRILEKQTNSQYTLNPKYKIFEFEENPASLAYLVEVPFIRGQALYAKAQNDFRTDFAWIPVDKIINERLITRPHHKRLELVAQSTKDLISKAWPHMFSPTTPLTQEKEAYEKKQNKQQGISGTEWPSNWFNLKNAIYFYNRGEPYYEFTNFYPHQITIDGKPWPSSEHYYQAQKFHDTNIQQQIQQAAGAREAFGIAQNNKHLVRPDWQQVNLKIMLKALQAKFKDPTLKKLLLQTDDKMLVENAGKKDDFFGAGADGSGNNHLGRLLMQVRQELRTGKK